jgi:hypothetical protein
MRDEGGRMNVARGTTRGLRYIHYPGFFGKRRSPKGAIEQNADTKLIFPRLLVQFLLNFQNMI